MAEFAVLECPTCESLRLCPADRFDDPTELKDVASDHLRSHRLAESKRGIFRIMMVQRSDRVEIERSTDLPTHRWIDEPESIPI